jgi:large subunit ribosomal protein L31
MKRLQTSQNKQSDAERRREARNAPAPKKTSLYQEVYGENEEPAS